MSNTEDYAKTVVCPNCNGEQYEPQGKYEMTYMDYVNGPRTCSYCNGSGTYNQMEEDERFDRLNCR